jgi:hypothetical protein
VETADLKMQLSRLRAQVFSIRINLNPYKTVELDPAEPNKYARVDTGNGYFLVSINNVTPFLDGQKVSLNVGNPLSATYNGFSLDIEWGPRINWENIDEAGYEKWIKARKQRSFSFTDRLLPGVWNSAEVILPATSSQDLGFMRLSMSTDNVSLRALQ